MTIREATRDTPAPSTVPGVRSAISSEFTKLTSVPTQRTLLAVAVGIAVLTAVVFYVSLPVTQGRAVRDLEPHDILGAGILGVDAAALVLLVLAAIHVGSEYATGMIQATLTITPARGQVLAGKFVTVSVAALTVGAIAAAACVGVALTVASTVGIDHRSVLTATGMQLALGSIAMPVFYSVIAASAAFVFRSTALGIVLPLAVMAVGGLADWFGDSASAWLTPLTPAAAIHSLSGVATGHESIGIAGAVLSLVVWLGVSIGAAAWRLLRRDV